MNKNIVRQKAKECIRLLQDVDFDRLGISQYNLEYIRQLLPDLEYHFRIYTDSILILLKKETVQKHFVDFGGGHGFLSILLKSLGFKVIYCDHNPLSVQTVTKLGAALNLSPDHIVEGSSAELHAYCAVNKLKPNYLIGTDLIEHVYDLNVFFANLHQINPRFKMIFTTCANPSNPYCVWKLRKLMLQTEKNIFFPMRSDFIQENYPELAEKERLFLAKQTRGLTYKTMEDAIEVYQETRQIPQPDVDKYNTCDPQSGNWMERILPLKDYQELLKKHGFKAEFKKGFYNEKRNRMLVSLFVKLVNKVVKYTGIIGRTICAYLIIKVIPR
ncbi:MAG: class I SAM-dependent methyltransferase [Dysgonamonadaceae bacterium]|jgi:SAM-dependent methyltransferase|nr:class I SAM-dependent methyltransferase [Dysgonamonadaceae bacterium]